MKKKSLFSILYSSIIWFIFCFIFEINSFDTIKNALNKGVNVIKNSYHWLKGDQTDFKKKTEDFNVTKISAKKNAILKKNLATENNNIITKETDTINTEDIVMEEVSSPVTIKENKKKLKTKTSLDLKNEKKIINKFIEKKKNLTLEKIENIKNKIKNNPKKIENIKKYIKKLL